MTQTRLETELLTTCRELLLNDPLAELLQKNFLQVGPHQFSQEEFEFAAELAKTFVEPDSILLDTLLAELKIVPPDGGGFGGASTHSGE